MDPLALVGLVNKFLLSSHRADLFTVQTFAILPGVRWECVCHFLFLLRLNKLNKHSLCFHDFVSLCFYVADPATFLTSVFFTNLFSSENSLFIQLWKK